MTDTPAEPEGITAKLWNDEHFKRRDAEKRVAELTSQISTLTVRLREDLTTVRRALEQALDDGDYIREDGSYITPDEKPHGGCYCAAAAGMLIDAIAILDRIGGG